MKRKVVISSKMLLTLDFLLYLGRSSGFHIVFDVTLRVKAHISC